MKKFRKASVININSLDEINEKLSYIKKCCFIHFSKPVKRNHIGYNAYIWTGDVRLHVLARFEGKVKEYVFSLCENEKLAPITGGQAFNILSRYVKVQRLEDPNSYGSSSAILYKNPKFNKKRVLAYEYDINSAFARQMLEPIPDTDTLECFTAVKKGQIGFWTDVSPNSGRTLLRACFEEGRICRYVCDLVPSPFHKFVKTWYDKKAKAKTLEDKAKAKAVLNYSIGALQNYNPFIRACIIERSNMYISQFIDENTIYANTDSIVSTVPRPDIEELLGTEIGQFKKEHYGELFAWQDTTVNYQRNYEAPAYRGVPKGWFDNFEKKKKRKFDILKDLAPDDDNTYSLDYYDLEVKMNYGKKKEKS